MSKQPALLTEPLGDNYPPACMCLASESKPRGLGIDQSRFTECLPMLCAGHVARSGSLMD